MHGLAVRHALELALNPLPRHPKLVRLLGVNQSTDDERKRRVKQRLARRASDGTRLPIGDRRNRCAGPAAKGPIRAPTFHASCARLG